MSCCDVINFEYVLHMFILIWSIFPEIAITLWNEYNLNLCIFIIAPCVSQVPVENCPPAFVAEHLGEYLHLLRTGQNAQREQTMLLVSLLSQFISSLKSPQSGFKGSLSVEFIYIYVIWGHWSICLLSLWILYKKLDMQMCSVDCRYLKLRTTELGVTF